MRVRGIDGGSALEQVFKAMYDGVHEVAIKIFNATGCNEEEASLLMNEISLLRTCRHSNIVQVHQWCWSALKSVCGDLHIDFIFFVRDFFLIFFFVLASVAPLELRSC